jgi:NO-binding membrane sensor protein with MHYT domain
MHLDWSALAQVAIASLVFGVGIALLFAVGVTALSRRAVAYEYNRPARFDTAIVGLCFAACAAAVLYGLYLIIPQFH